MKKLFDSILLDSRFGLRMLMKHRGLTVVGVFATAVAIAVGATLFEVFSELLGPTLPFTDSSRIVGVQFPGPNPDRPERHVIHDFAEFQGQLRSIEHFGAYRNAEYNLVAADTAPEPVTVAEISASVFTITGVPASKGRFLLPADEEPSAPPVVVIGHQAWQLRFAGDPAVIGRNVKLGGISRTVVGVMPEEFKFPTNHQFWIPFRAEPLKYARWEGPSIFMLGRLAPAATLEQAQAEVTAIAQRTSVAHPITKRPLQPQVVPFTRGFLEPSVALVMRAGQFLVGILTFVVAINLAILIYARTMTRLGEIAVRSALGASRARILAQLFIEALALSLVGAGVGLAISRYALGVIQALAHTNGGLPYWVTFELSMASVLYAAGLALMAAFIMGVLPGLKATGTRINSNLHELHGRGGTRLGATWTTLIVAQVAVAVAVLPVAVFVAARVIRMEMVGAGFAADSVVVARAEVDLPAGKIDGDLLRERQADLIARLRREPGVVGVAFASSIPGFAGSEQIRFADGVRRRTGAEHVPDVGITDALFPSVVRGSVDLFDSYGVQVLAGRNFTAADAATPEAVIVNHSFAQMYLQDGNALGVRFKYVRDVEGAPLGEASPPERWMEVVGVVRDFPAFPPDFLRAGEPTIYHAANVGDMHPVTVSVRFAGTVPPEFIGRFRQIGAEVDSAMQLHDVGVLADRYTEGRSALRSLAWAMGLVTLSVLLLSAAGIYALMSFTVSQRTREIGIRTALGAAPGRVLVTIFRRAAWQVGGGVLVGTALSGGAFVATGLNLSGAAPLLVAVATIMALVGLLAAFAPARRGLRIQAIEALRADG